MQSSHKACGKVLKNRREIYKKYSTDTQLVTKRILNMNKTVKLYQLVDQRVREREKRL